MESALRLVCARSARRGRSAGRRAATLPLARMPSRASAEIHLGRRPLRRAAGARRIPRTPPGRTHRLERRRGAGAQSPRRAPRRCSCWRAARARRPRDLYVSYAGAFARVNRNHDIVLVDQRGTGRSAPLVLQLSAMTGAKPASECRHCGRRRSPACSNMAIACATTPAASRSRDLERVREALGYRADRSLRRLLRHAHGGALHAAPPRSATHAVMLGRRDLSRASDRSRHAAGRRARAGSHRGALPGCAGLRRGLPELAAEISSALRAKIRPRNSRR